MKKLPVIKDSAIRLQIDDIKKKILDLYSKPPGYYESELADRFHVEFKYIRRALCELKEEGKF